MLRHACDPLAHGSAKEQQFLFLSPYSHNPPIINSNFSRYIHTVSRTLIQNICFDFKCKIHQAINKILQRAQKVFEYCCSKSIQIEIEISRLYLEALILILWGPLTLVPLINV